MDNEREDGSRHLRESSKWHKQLENTALQTSLNLQRVEDSRQEEEEAGTAMEQNGETGEELVPAVEEEMPPVCQLTAEEKERTLTDHLNKKLLSSFLEKLNQAEFPLPAALQTLQRNGDEGESSEDSNRMEEDW